MHYHRSTPVISVKNTHHIPGRIERKEEIERASRLCFLKSRPHPFLCGVLHSKLHSVISCWMNAAVQYPPWIHSRHPYAVCIWTSVVFSYLFKYLIPSSLNDASHYSTYPSYPKCLEVNWLKCHIKISLFLFYNSRRAKESFNIVPNILERFKRCPKI